MEPIGVIECSKSERPGAGVDLEGEKRVFGVWSKDGDLGRNEWV
jgi:hypothetical protein